jgi:cytochrome c
MKTSIYLAVSVFIILFLSSRAISKEAPAESDSTHKTSIEKTDSIKQADPSSPHGEDMGVGPIKEVKLGPIDQKLAEQGESLFETKCTMCHSLDEKKIGPALQDVTKQRTPEFIMNLLVNTSEMEQKDQTMKKMISEYAIPMTDLHLSETEARALLEYLRSVASPTASQ